MQLYFGITGNMILVVSKDHYDQVGCVSVDANEELNAELVKTSPGTEFCKLTDAVFEYQGVTGAQLKMHMIASGHVEHNFS